MRQTREEKDYLLSVEAQKCYNTAKALVEPYYVFIATANILEKELDKMVAEGLRNTDDYLHLELDRDWELQQADTTYREIFMWKKKGEKFLKKTEARWWRR